MYVHTCLNVSQTLVCNLIESCKVYVGLSAKQLHVVPVALNQKKKKKEGSISSECEDFFCEIKLMMKEKVLFTFIKPSGRTFFTLVSLYKLVTRKVLNF